MECRDVRQRAVPVPAGRFRHLFLYRQAHQQAEEKRQGCCGRCGGTGAFLCAAGQAYPALQLGLFDLPVVVANAAGRLDAAGLLHRSRIYPGSFRDDPLPQGADAVSLIRVLYDHDDSTVRSLLAAIRKTLPPAGRLIISEPMSGGARPDRATDVYFSIYTLAMQTGRTRSLAEIGALLAGSGFDNIKETWGYRPFVTSVITARSPAQ